MKSLLITSSRNIAALCMLLLLAGSMGATTDAAGKGLLERTRKAISKVQIDSVAPAPLVDDNPIDPRGKKSSKSAEEEPKEEKRQTNPRRK